MVRLMKSALKHFNLTEKQLDALLEKRINEGWKCAERGMMIPPDDRINWCAEWIPYKGKLLPHWIIGER